VALVKEKVVPSKEEASQEAPAVHGLTPVHTRFEARAIIAQAERDPRTLKLLLEQIDP
jgi:hypothetical protein